MRKALSLILALLSLLGSLAAEDPSLPRGRYQGELQLPGGPSPLELRLLEEGGGLLDLPVLGIHSYPLSGLELSATALHFALGQDGAASGYLRFDLESQASADPAQALRLVGTFSGSGGQGEVWLSPVSDSGGNRGDLAFEVKGGRLKGSLLLPEGPGPHPLLILVPGSGTTDRDGNNYSVPGKNDAYLQLALALARLGVATARYDKRGSGESYLLAGPEAETSFDDYIEDAQAVIGHMAASQGFSRVSVVGHTEGALVAAAALNRLKSDLDLALLCATGKTAVDLVEASLAEVPADKMEEAKAIMASLKAGRPWPEPSEFFADFFRPSFQSYLMSWFRTDLVAELKARQGRVLLVQGNRDFQVSLQEFALLAAARPEAPALVLPGMNHMLKEVPSDLDENWRAFSDPAFPLAEGLVDLLAAWARGGDLPTGPARFDGGVQAAPSPPSLP